MAGDRPPHVRSARVELDLTLPDWAIAELERHSLERPDETIDGFVSELIRRWAERRQAERLGGTVAGLARR